MLWGLDAAFLPAGDQVERLYAQGWRFWGGYIGGRAEHVWSLDDWQLLAASGFALLPIWVAPASDQTYDQGVSEGNAALEAMQALGLTGLVMLDIENGADLTTYTSGFVDAVHAGSCRAGIYGTQPTIETVGQNVKTDAWWLALWPCSPMPQPPAPPDWSLWQWAAGESVDFNVAWDQFEFAQRVS